MRKKLQDVRCWFLLLLIDRFKKLDVLRAGTAALPDFRKLYGVVKEDIPAGTYQLTINNRMFVVFVRSCRV
jgi:hypothetical protein